MGFNSAFKGLIEAHFFGDGKYFCTTHSCPHNADDDSKVMVVI